MTMEGQAAASAAGVSQEAGSTAQGSSAAHETYIPDPSENLMDGPETPDDIQADLLKDPKTGKSQRQPPPQSKQPQAQPWKMKLKIDGVEREIDENEARTRLQKEYSAEKRYQQAAEMMKGINAFFEDPLAFAKQRGMDPKNVAQKIFQLARKHQIDIDPLAEEYLLEKIRWERATPEQREALQLQEKARQYESELERYKRQEQEIQRAQYQRQAVQDIDTHLTQAIDELGRKPSKYDVAILSAFMSAHLDNGGSLDGKKIAGQYKALIGGALESRLSTLSVDEALKILPKPLLDGLRKAQVDRALSADPMKGQRQPRPNNEPSGKSSKKAPRIMSVDEAFKQLEKKWE